MRLSESLFPSVATFPFHSAVRMVLNCYNAKGCWSGWVSLQCVSGNICKIALNTPATMASFNEQVYRLVRRVPEGRVITYGSIARLLGDPRKAREVGWAMAVCPEDVPAHRVINRFGAVSGYASTTEGARRRSMLEVEGVLFDSRGRCDLGVYEWLPRNVEVTDA